MFFVLFLLLPIIPIFGLCPNGSIPSIHDPTNCYIFATNKTNWFGADQTCSGLGGNLASFHDMFENMYVSGEAGTIFLDSTTTDFWIGANNIFSPGKWSWIDNSSFDFTDWDNGQPQNTTGTVCVSSQLNGARWLSFDCYEAKPFVCLVKNVPNPTICPETWTFYEQSGSCYKAIQPATTWYESERLCINEGAHLASIHNYNENLFITYLTNNSTMSCDWHAQAWIGLSKEDGTNFLWTDGTAFDYHSWTAGAPGGSANNCVVSWIGQSCWGEGWSVGATQWGILPCDTKVGYAVCKKLPKI